MSTAVALYNEQYPKRALGVFDACAAAQSRGNELYIQITCQPLSFDFTLASAYPFYSHPAFDPIKAYDREQLKAVFGDPSFRERFRADLRNPKPGTVFQGNWGRIVVAAPVRPDNARFTDRTIADIARETGHDPLDVLLDLGLEENLDTGLVGRFFNAVDDGVEPLVKHKAGVIALSDAGAHLVYLCDAGFGLYFLGHWVRERGAFDLPDGVRRLTSHQANLYGIPDRGRIAIGAHADLLLFDPSTVGISSSRRVNDLPGGGSRTLRNPIGVHGVFVNGVRVFDGKDYVRLGKGPGHVLDRFLPARANPIGERGAINSAVTGEAMPVDPQIQALLDKGTGVPATHTLSVDVARAQYEARIALMTPPAEIAGVREQTVAGPGGPLRIRIYTPHGTAPFPMLVFFHGSGFVLCSLDTHDGMCRNLCAGAGCVVASVDYRLAPSTNSQPASTIACMRRAGRGTCRRAGRRPNAHCRLWRQRRGQYGSGHCAQSARPGRPVFMRPAAALSGDRLPHAWHSFIRRKRRGLRADSRNEEMVLGPLFERRGGECTSTRFPAACPGSDWFTPCPRNHCRIRPAARRRRILCREVEGCPRVHCFESLSRCQSRLHVLGGPRR
jgi:hypothetical protein